MGSEIGFNIRGRQSLIPTSSNHRRPRSNTPAPTISSSIPSAMTISFKTAVYKRTHEQEREEKHSNLDVSNASHSFKKPVPVIQSSISVAELATRFLEENVRNCTKPRIFPRIFPVCFPFLSFYYSFMQHNFSWHFINFLRELQGNLNFFLEQTSLYYSPSCTFFTYYLLRIIHTQCTIPRNS